MRTHPGLQPFVCDICLRKFGNARDFTSHRESDHPSLTSATIALLHSSIRSCGKAIRLGAKSCGSYNSKGLTGSDRHQ